MQLYFLRHGIAEDAGPGMSDDERALTTEGRTQLKVIAKAMQRLAIRPNNIFTSPLVRTRETAEIVVPVVGGTLHVAPELAPGCTWEQLQRVLQQVKGQQTLVVGHAPDMGSLAATLIGADGNAIAVKKAGLVRVDYDGKPVVGIGLLHWVLTPQQLAWIGAA